MHAAGGTGAGGPALRSGPRAAQVELVPGGQHRAVAAGNRAEYIMRMANFRLNVQIRAASNAFRAGLEAVVERAWLRMFHESELQARPARPPAAGCVGARCRVRQQWLDAAGAVGFSCVRARAPSGHLAAMHARERTWQVHAG